MFLIPLVLSLMSTPDTHDCAGLLKLNSFIRDHWPSELRTEPTQIHFSEELPEPSAFLPNTLVIYDEVLERTQPLFASWIANFPHRYAVKAGEKLKAVEDFAQHMKAISTIAASFPASVRILAIGGGTVGDFSAFVASVYKRGVPLEHIPSTWVAVIDSAHGGKTALNIAGAKNQIGTFYPAQRVHLVRSLIATQPDALVEQGFAEFLKMALIDGGPWAAELGQSKDSQKELLLRFMLEAIAGKYRIFLADPYENTGTRQLLNFGHTVGHIIETEHKWPHGDAVVAGMAFALRWGVDRDLMSVDTYTRIFRDYMSKLKVPEKTPMSKARFYQLLAADKKSQQAGSVKFIFLKDVGAPEILAIPFDAVASEAKLQGWIAK